MLIETYDGLLSQLADLRTGWLHSLRAGLFTGDFQPSRGATIDDVEPCSFSGYSGLRDLVTWNAAGLVGQRGVIQHGYLLWHHDGGPIAQKVQGYYVIDRAGKLCWAELRSDGFVIMQSAADVYRLVPKYSLRSEF